MSAKLQKARFACASRGEVLKERNWDQSEYDCASLQGASLDCAQLQGAWFNS